MPKQGAQKVNSNPPTPFGDYLVFVDESGDHGLAAVNRDFPLFALAFCVFPKEAYVNEVTPAVRRLKLATFGHDLVVLHEHDIRKKAGAFAKISREPREQFLDALSRVIEAAPFTLLAVVIDKRELQVDCAESANPYHLALQFGLERVFRMLAERGQAERLTHFIVEARGKREDTELELEFRRICEGNNGLSQALPFRLVMADKRANSEGLQIAGHGSAARRSFRLAARPTEPGDGNFGGQTLAWAGWADGCLRIKVLS